MVAEVIIMREEEKKRISQPSAIQKFFRKRWVFPAIYLVSAALILTAVLWFQANNDKNGKNGTDEFSEGTAYNGEEPAVEVGKQLENLEMPVQDPKAVVVKTNYYDDKASKEDQEAALVFYNNTYHPSTGIDLVMKDGKSFDVAAAASGTVTKAEKDPILGYVVEIDHQDGIVTHYQSLANVEVEAGDTVKQGEVIAKAGQSSFNKEAKTHVHFEVRKDDQPLNPNDFVGKPLTAIKEQKVSESTEPTQSTSDESSEPSESPTTTEEQDNKNASENAEQPSTDNEDKQSEEDSKNVDQEKKEEGSNPSSDASDMNTNA
jgi:stage II sporulation protein Q